MISVKLEIDLILKYVLLFMSPTIEFLQVSVVTFGVVQDFGMRISLLVHTLTL